MARSHGVLLASIWDDEHWLALDAGAQRVYALLISQPKLTLVGLLDYLPSRWARLAADTTVDDIERGVTQLETSPSRFVLVDRHTDELLIRTLVKHDVSRTLTNRNLLQGLWRAWATISSRQLRLAAVREIPEAIWTTDRCQPHPDAVQMRSSAWLQPTIETDRSDQPSGQPDRTSLIPKPSSRIPPPETPTADPQQPVDSRGDEAAEAAAVDNSCPPAYTGEARTQRLGDAVDLLVARELERNPTRGGNPERHAGAVRQGKLGDHRQRGFKLLADFPELSPADLADLLEPPSAAPAADRYDHTQDGPQRAMLERARAGNAQVAEILATPPADHEVVRAALAEARQQITPPTGGEP